MPSRSAALLCGALTALTGCAASQSEPETASRAEGNVPATCTLTRVERIRSEGDIDTDAAFLMLVYTPGEDQGPAIRHKVQVRRERVDQVRDQLEARPEVWCVPERGAPGGYRVELPPEVERDYE